MASCKFKREPIVIQFNKPGAEHNPNHLVTPKNGVDHKKICTQGWSPVMLKKKKNIHKNKYLQVGGRIATKKVNKYFPSAKQVINFWTEWEPPSRYQIINPKEKREMNVQSKKGAKNIHFPISRLCVDKRKYHNTDPLILGKEFIYSNCKQRRYKKFKKLVNNLNSKDPDISLGELMEGDMILFGSTFEEKFYLSTLFIVESCEPYTPNDKCKNREIGQSSVENYIYKPLVNSGFGEIGYVEYKAKMLEGSSDELFSFFPCKLRGEESAPTCELGSDIGGCSFVKKALINGPFIIGSSKNTVVEVWKDVVRKVELSANNLRLGVCAELPKV